MRSTTECSPSQYDSDSPHGAIHAGYDPAGSEGTLTPPYT
jgi:hypothetical protein